jgi:Protein of unknown function (DUF4007)
MRSIHLYGESTPPHSRRYQLPNLTFHATFGFKRPELAKLVGNVAENPGLKRKALGTRCGFGTEKIGPLTKWAALAGLIDTDSMKLTAIGEHLLSSDPALSRTDTLWLMQLNLTDYNEWMRKSDAVSPAWAFFCHDFLTRMSYFTRQELQEDLEFEFGRETSPKYIQSSAGLILATYSDEESLGNLGIVLPNESAFGRGQPAPPSCSVLAYWLTKDWEARFASKSSRLLADVIDGKAGLTEVFGLAPKDAERALESLAQQELLGLDRSVKPHTIRLRTNLAPAEAFKQCSTR